MARKIDPNSVRQKAMRYLEQHKMKKRAELIEDLMKEFGIVKGYAENLYAHFRNVQKDEGAMKKFYTIRLKRNGYPELKSYYAFEPKGMDSDDKEIVMKNYISYLINMMEQDENQSQENSRTD